VAKILFEASIETEHTKLDAVIKGEATQEIPQIMLPVIQFVAQMLLEELTQGVCKQREAQDKLLKTQHP
jgi:hypothetical protein